MRLPFALVAASLAFAAPAAAAQPPEVQYYQGTSEIFLANGRSVGKQAALVERILDPDRHTIVERVLGPDHEHPGRFSEYVVTFAVAKDGTLAMHERHGAFDGTGRVVGEAWKWHAWHTVSTLPDGTKVDSDDHLEQGTLTTHKTVYGPDGKLQVKLTESYKPIDAAAFERVYYDWMLRPDGHDKGAL